jgi:hypothetical protein
MASAPSNLAPRQPNRGPLPNLAPQLPRDMLPACPHQQTSRHREPRTGLRILRCPPHLNRPVHPRPMRQPLRVEGKKGSEVPSGCYSQPSTPDSQLCLPLLLFLQGPMLAHPSLSPVIFPVLTGITGTRRRPRSLGLRAARNPDPGPTEKTRPCRHRPMLRTSNASRTSPNPLLSAGGELRILRAP